MTTRRTAVGLVIGPPLCGVLLAVLVAAAWLIAGLPTAKADIWFRVAELQPTGEASFTSAAPDHVQFFLVVGNDSSGPNDRNGIGLGDALHVVGVNPAAHAATILDIPRDTAVPIPGRGTTKINAALPAGGLRLMTETIRQFVGVPITFAMTTNFDGFIKMINEIGGIDVDIQQPMHDPKSSGANFDPGPLHLMGEDALAYVRDRESFPQGDIKRTENQAYLMISALQNLQRRNPGPAGTLSLLGLLARHVDMENTTLVDLYRLGRLVLTIDPANIRNVVIPTGSGSATNLSPGPGVQDLFADFRDDATLQSH